jgi:hypothetical protein
MLIKEYLEEIVVNFVKLFVNAPTLLKSYFLEHYPKFYHGYCKDERKAAFIILQQTHGYWKIDAHHYI